MRKWGHADGAWFHVVLVDDDGEDLAEECLRATVETLRTIGEPKCDKCARRGQAPHACPYQSEIHDDSETLCTCCEACEGQCSDDV